MNKKLIITEEQASKLKNYLKENILNDSEIFFNKIYKDLKLNYEPVMGIYRQGGEYFEKPMIKVKVDNEEITPKDVLYYFKNKYKNIKPEFIKQVIIDWINGNDKLSKNIAINESFKDYFLLNIKVLTRQGREDEALARLIYKGYSPKEASKYIENIKKSI